MASYISLSLEFKREKEGWGQEFSWYQAAVIGEDGEGWEVSCKDCVQCFLNKISLNFNYCILFSATKMRHAGLENGEVRLVIQYIFMSYSLSLSRCRKWIISSSELDTTLLISLSRSNVVGIIYFFNFWDYIICHRWLTHRKCNF